MWLLYVLSLRGKSEYGLVWPIMINPPEHPINDEAQTKRMLQEQMCGCTKTKKRNRKLVMHHKISYIKDVEIRGGTGS